jgi:iron complex outermembrane recepter protein
MRIQGLFARTAAPLGWCVFAATSGPAHAETEAQGQSTSSQEVYLEEIIVTAQKREERLIDVPAPITAVTADDIAARGAADLESLQFDVPGLSALEYGPGEERAQLRGISSNYGRETVGRYLDEMPINSEIAAVSPDIRLIDMERIEVLRGPQPTLYGDGSMGGTIRYVTASPDLKEASGSVTLDGNSVQDGAAGYLVNGHVSVPLVEDRVGLRIAAGYEDQGGWIDRVPTGEKNINDYEIGTVRAKLLVKLADQSDLSVMFMHQKTDNPNQAFGVDDKTYLTVPTPLDTDYDLANIVLRINLGFAELVETPGYLDYRIHSQFDFSPFYVPLVQLLGFPPGYVTQVAEDGDTDTKTYSNELRLVSSAGTPWSWATGFDYRHTTTSGPNYTTTAPNALPFAVLATNATDLDKIWALWVEGGYTFNDRLTVKLGARYYHDETNESGTVTALGVPSLLADKGTFTSTNPRLNLSYQVAEDQLVYVEAAKGFRSGGFNSDDPTYRTFAPESLWTYELGSKGEYWNRRLSLEADVYYNDWRDVQDSFTLPNGLGVILNGGHVTGEGFDFVTTLAPSKDLHIGITYGWNNLAYKEVPPNADKDVGDPPDYAVRNAWSTFADYTHPVAAGVNAYGRVDFAHKGQSQETLRTPPYNIVAPVPAQDLLNLRLGLTFRNYDASIYAKNLTNERAPILAPFGILTEDVEQRPRVLGITVRANF